MLPQEGKQTEPAAFYHICPGEGVEMKKFVVVKESNNVYQFSKFHESSEEAYEEAERLCRKEEEAERLCRKEHTTFYVLRVLAKCYIEETPVKWIEIV